MVSFRRSKEFQFCHLAENEIIELEDIEMIRKSFIAKVTGSVFLTLFLVGAPIKLVSVAEIEESRKELFEAQAYYTAVAGIQEAIARIAIGEIQDPHNPPNPNWQVEIYPSPHPESRGDTLCLSSVQNREDFLPYCSHEYPLIIHYLLDGEDLDGDGERKEMVYYNPSNPKLRSTEAIPNHVPIFIITATGVEGTVKKTLEMEIVLENGRGSPLKE